jgi:hypothetical protein
MEGGKTKFVGEIVGANDRSRCDDDGMLEGLFEDDGAKVFLVGAIVKIGAADVGGGDDGAEVGLEVGRDDGAEVGLEVGRDDGAEVGLEVGRDDGAEDSCDVGAGEEMKVGIKVFSLSCKLGDKIEESFKDLSKLAEGAP